MQLPANCPRVQIIQHYNGLITVNTISPPLCVCVSAYISHNNNNSQACYDNPNLTQEVIPCLPPTTVGFAAVAAG